MAFQVADLFEHVVDVVGDRTALICEPDRRTFAELEARSNRFAHHLASVGIAEGDHVGIYGPNSVEWVEAMLACFKLRAVPININFRYVTDELRYLFDNADLKAIVFEEELGPRIAAIRSDLPQLDHAVMVERGLGTDQLGLDHVAFEAAVASGSPERDFAPRSGDDHVIIYTGGTTGMPKGVVWRSEDIFFALAGGIDPFSREPVADEWVQSKAAAAAAGQLVFMNIPPLMHGAAYVSTMMQLFQGNVNVLIRRFDPYDVWRQIDTHRVNSVLIAGDAIGRPLIEALDEAEASGSEPLDLSCLISLSSSAAVFSPTVKERFLARFPDLIVTDSIGATESGFNGLITVSKDNTAMRGGGPTVSPGRDTTVLDEDLRPVEPGSGVIGKVARTGNVPIGYYKDEAKTKATFVVAADGRRYSMPGDFASVEADGSITLLGRGSVCINTGGEKVFPEEVEQVLKAHPDVFDALVVGVPDDRWGSRVAAVVEPRAGASLTLAQLDEHCRGYIAGYKVPRELHLVEVIARSPAGKPDYPWAKRVATGLEPAGSGTGR